MNHESAFHDSSQLVRMAPDTKLFVGFKLDGRVKLKFDAKPRGDYVGPAGEGKMLTSFEYDGHLYVGKLVDGGLATDRVDDVARHVLSVVRRMVESEKLPNALSIFAAPR